MLVQRSVHIWSVCNWFLCYRCLLLFFFLFLLLPTSPLLSSTSFLPFSVSLICILSQSWVLVLNQRNAGPEDMGTVLAKSSFKLVLMLRWKCMGGYKQP